MEPIINDMNQEELKELIFLMFDGYKERKKKNILYRDKDNIPELIIKYYYSYATKPEFGDIFSNFKKEYIDNEDRIENEIQNDFHSIIERKGLSKVYDYIHTYIPNENLNIYIIMNLHQKLFSEAPYPEYAGNFRTEPAHIPGAKLDLTPHEYIAQEMANILQESNIIIEEGKELGLETDPKIKTSKIIPYIEKCIELKCKLIKIHPFRDGNGRTIRAFLNLLFKLANIPPVYIEYEEREEYKKAMNKANGEENDFDDIQTFYKYKICDSIIKLDLSYNEEKNKLKNKEKPLRNIKNLLEIFYYGTCSSKQKIITKKISKYEIILDEKNEDYALYCEDNNTLLINLKDDNRCFTIKQIETEFGSQINFLIEDTEVNQKEFNNELKDIYKEKANMPENIFHKEKIF